MNTNSNDQTDHQVGLAGEMEWVLASDLHIDRRYQRDIDMRFIHGFARDFNPDILGVLIVSLRADGNFYVIDGQHRLLGIRGMGWGDQLLPCLVHQGLTSVEEAKIFSESQRKRRNLSPQALMKAELEWRNPDAMAIAEIVEAAGFHLNLDSSERSGGRIVAVGTLRKVTKSYAGALDAVLELIAEAWGTEEGPRGVLIEGIAAFLYRYGGVVDQRRLVERLGSLNAERVENDGKLDANVNGLNHPDGVGHHIVKVYNYRLMDHRKLESWEMAANRRRLSLRDRVRNVSHQRESEQR